MSNDHIAGGDGMSSEAFEILTEMGELLSINMDRRTLTFALRLIEDKMEPVKLAELLRNWRANDAQRIESQLSSSSSTESSIAK